MAAKGPSTLTNAPINLLALREDGKRELLALLDEMHGRVCVVLGQGIMGPLQLIITEGFKTLKEHGAAALQELEPKRLETQCDSVFYLVRPTVPNMQAIAAQVKDLPQAIEITIAFVPRRTVQCEHVLREMGVAGRCNIEAYHIDLIPFDDDLLSLEMDSAFKECYLDGESSSLFYIARALNKLQSLYGSIPDILVKGNLSKIVLKMMLKQADEEAKKGASSGGADGGTGAATTTTSEIDMLILMDRQVDMITPMVTPLTFEALVDELFHIDNGVIVVDSKLFGDDEKDSAKTPKSGKTPKSRSKNKPISLNSDDKLFAEVRHLNIQAVPPVLEEKSRDTKKTYDNRKNLHKERVAELKKYVKKMPGIQQMMRSLEVFVPIMVKLREYTDDPAVLTRWKMEQAILEERDSKAVFEYIMGLIARREPKLQVLQLISLQCLCDGGFKDKILRQYRQALVQTYGFELLLTVPHLETLGLLKPHKRGANAWSAVRSKLQLVQDEVKVLNPTDIAYTTSGYAPLSVRLAELAVTHGWASPEVADVLRMLPGATDGHSQARAGKHDDAAHTARKTVVVFYIGGVTYLEIAAYRFLSEKLPIDFIVATTKLTRGSTLLGSIVEPVPNGIALGSSAAAASVSGAGGGAGAM